MFTNFARRNPWNFWATLKSPLDFKILKTVKWVCLFLTILIYFNVVIRCHLLILIECLSYYKIS
jgi:hypothetical protein